MKIGNGYNNYEQLSLLYEQKEKKTLTYTYCLVILSSSKTYVTWSVFGFEKT